MVFSSSEVNLSVRARGGEKEGKVLDGSATVSIANTLLFGKDNNPLCGYCTGLEEAVGQKKQNKKKRRGCTATELKVSCFYSLVRLLFLWHHNACYEIAYLKEYRQVQVISSNRILCIASANINITCHLPVCSLFSTAIG